MLRSTMSSRLFTLPSHTLAQTPPHATRYLGVPVWSQKRICSSVQHAAYATDGTHVSATTFAANYHQVPSLDVQRKLQEELGNEPAEFASGSAVLDSIVKVFTVHSRPNYFLPWQNHPKRESTGTGFVIKDGIILTNAHVVADHTYVTVKRHGSGAKYKAEVVATGHDCDLALLKVTNPEFWRSPTNMLPLALGEVPTLQEGVAVVGYPTGGDNASITSGVVSRVEVAQYAHAASHLMAIQIDAAINPGNSGGPALQGDVVVGVAFQNIPHADNIGYVIPTPVVRRFLSEVSMHGQYRGYCSLGVMCQNMENPHLRAALRMPPDMTGVLVNTIQPTSSASKVLKKADVLLAFDGVPIANDGTVHFRRRERIYFSSLITQKSTGQEARVKVLRQGVVEEFEVVLQPVELLVPVHQYDRLPSYYIFGGLVFMPLTQPYLHEFGDDWLNTCPRRLYDKAMHAHLQRKGQQIVVVSQILVDDVNAGYQQFQGLQVLRVNGEEVLNVAHLKTMVEAAAKAAATDSDSDSSPFVRLELEDDRLIYLDLAAAAAASQRVQDRYRVPDLVSRDLVSHDLV